MKITAQNKGNLAPANPERLKDLREMAIEASTNEENVALLWTEEDGFVLHVPWSDVDKPMSKQSYLLGICFMRLTTDPNFVDELINWADKNAN